MAIRCDRLVWVLVALGITTAVGEVSPLPTEGPYAIILQRNAFGLKDPPPPPSVTATNPPPIKSTVQLVGISVSALGRYAMLVLPVGPGRTNATSLRLSTRPDDEDSGIKVLEIDERAGRVKIRNAGVEETLDFQHNAPALTAAALPAGVGGPGAPGIPGRPGAPGIPTPAAFNRPGSVPVPGAVPGGTPGAPATSGVIRSGYSGGAGAGVVTPSLSAESATRTIPGRPVRTTPAPEVPAVDPALQLQHMNEQLREMENQGLPVPPRLPDQ